MNKNSRERRTLSHSSKSTKSSTGKIHYEPEAVAKDKSEYLKQFFEYSRMEKEDTVVLTDLSDLQIMKEDVSSIN